MRNGETVKIIGEQKSFSMDSVIKLSQDSADKIVWDKTKKIATSVGFGILGGVADVLIAQAAGKNETGYFRGLGAGIEGLVLLLPSVALGAFAGYELSKYMYFSSDERKAISLLTCPEVINSSKQVILNNDAMDTIDLLDKALKGMK